MVVYSFLNEMIDNSKISEVWLSPEVSAVSQQGKTVPLVQLLRPRRI